MSDGIVVVTGFGPFYGHPINASWEAVKNLPRKIENYTIQTKEIPVNYELIDNEIPSLWEEFKPALVVHCGVSHIATTLTLEENASRIGYLKQDVCGGLPKHKNACACSGSDCISTKIDVKQIVQHINNTALNVQACCSDDAGRYLCEYTYYKSLSIDDGKALFIHVPPLDNPYSVEELANGISEIIRFIIKNVLKDKEHL